MLERTEKSVVKNSALRAMLQFNKPKSEETENPKSEAVKPKTKAEPKKRNERAYARYRGKSDGVATKPMSYYISDEHVSALEKRIKVGTEKDKSQIVREALELYLMDELEEIRKGKVSV